jgi:GT2 family glycosyltransferase
MKLDQLAILIVTFKSDEILSDLLINLQKFNVVIIENSSNENFREIVTKKHPNVKCILTNSNIGFGSALNIAFDKFKFQNYLILNPDIRISEEEIINIYSRATSDINIDVIAPSTLSENNKLTKRHGFFKLSKKEASKFKDLIKVDYVSGHAFLIKKHVLDVSGKFDENFFLNFEEHDLFFRIKKSKFNVFVMKNCFATHYEGKSANSKFLKEMTLSSKWHYGWGFFFFFNKHYSKFFSFIFSLNYFINSFIKFCFFHFKKEDFKKKLMLYTMKGMLAAFRNKKSYFRPKI